MMLLRSFWKWFVACFLVALVIYVVINTLVQLFWPETGTINVTRQDYDAALNKWRSQGVREYEIVVDYGADSCSFDPLVCGTWHLHVNGDKINILGYSFNGITEPNAKPSDLKSLTIDGLFDEVDKTLDNGPFILGPFPIDHVFSFDTTLGYPTKIEQIQRQPKSGYVSTDTMPAGWTKEVRSLKIISSK